MTGWEVFTGQPLAPPGMLAGLADLRAALPDYDVIVTRRAGRFRYEAIRRHGDGPWCVISADPADLWRELAPGNHPTIPPAHAP